MSNYGIRISTNDNDALTQPDNRLVYSSKFATPKYFKKFYIAVTTNGSGAGVVKIPHGLGYAPTHYVWRKQTASLSFLDGSSYTGAFHPAPGTSNPWVSNHKTMNCYTDNTNLTIAVQAANSTTYNFIYYIFIDQAEFNNATGGDTDEDYGLKVSKAGENADTATEQKTQYSSAYGTLMFYKEMITDYGPISLPALAGDLFDQTPQAGTYVDFMHPLNYPPFFLAYAEISGNRYLLPDGVPTLNGSSDYAFTGWCDKERIRISLYEKAQYSATPAARTSFTAITASLRVRIFLENLNLQ